MAAGKGTRLHPFTDNNPKPLIRVGGISLIERNILKLKENNVSEVIINVHHFGEKIINFLGEGSNYGLKISYSLEKELLGTGCLLYTSPSPRDATLSRMPSSA